MKAVDIYNLAKSNNVFNNFLGNKFDKDDIQIIDKMIQFGYNKYYNKNLKIEEIKLTIKDHFILYINFMIFYMKNYKYEDIYHEFSNYSERKNFTKMWNEIYQTHVNQNWEERELFFTSKIKLDKNQLFYYKNPLEFYGEIKDILSFGSYGQVHQMSNPDYVIKVFNKNEINFTATDDFIIETNFSQINNFNCPQTSNHIISSIDYGLLQDGRRYIIYPSYEKDLLFLAFKKMLSLSQKIDIIYQILIAIKHMHSQNFYHRDIKLNNFLYKKNNNRYDIVLTDLSFISYSFPTKNITNETRRYYHHSYRSFENLLGSKKINEKSEMWAVGIIIFEILTQKALFNYKEDLTIKKVVQKLGPITTDIKEKYLKKYKENNEITEILNDDQLFVEDQYYRYCKNSTHYMIIKPLVEYDKDKRMNISQYIEFFKDFVRTNLGEKYCESFDQRKFYPHLSPKIHRNFEFAKFKLDVKNIQECLSLYNKFEYINFYIFVYALCMFKHICSIKRDYENKRYFFVCLYISIQILTNISEFDLILDHWKEYLEIYNLMKGQFYFIHPLNQYIYSQKLEDRKEYFRNNKEDVYQTYQKIINIIVKTDLDIDDIVLNFEVKDDSVKRLKLLKENIENKN
jgi:serine/threonine protein kinase